MKQKIKMEDKTKELEGIIKNIEFFSDQIRFNSIIYQGINLLLEKVTRIEEKLNTKT